MKKILNMAIVCALALLFLSVSDVFAVNTTNLANREYKITGVAERYDPDGYNGAGQITQGTVLFGTPDEGILVVHNIASDLYISVFGLYFELYTYIQLGPYTTGPNKVKSTECTVYLFDTTKTQIWTIGPAAPCNATIKFDTKKAFRGTIEIPDFWDTGTSAVMNFNGKFQGTWPTAASSATSLPGALLKGSPGGVPKLFPKK